MSNFLFSSVPVTLRDFSLCVALGVRGVEREDLPLTAWAILPKSIRNAVMPGWMEVTLVISAGWPAKAPRLALQRPVKHVSS